MIAAYLPQIHDGPGAVDPGSSPLPGGVTELVRAVMNAPSWLQIGGGLLLLAAGAGLVFLLVRHRASVFVWLRGLPTAGRAALVAVALAAVALASAGGYAGYDYVSHNNSFCTGCHVMVDAFVRFQESPHSQLGCHDCHQQPVSASLRQLYLWVVERPDDIGAHAPVPDARCASCHVESDPEQWPQIAASLGHRVHLDSDHPELTEVLCVSCHGVRVHDFAPARETCGQCHEEASEIRLGRMSGATDVHCVVCHDFLGADPARIEGLPQELALMPSRLDCVTCHEMARLVVEEELAVDPHGAVCGACHNPHDQATPADAVGTCTACHEQSETLTPFHRGRHAAVHAQCTACHEAHRWNVEGLDCIACHETIMAGHDTGGPGERRSWMPAAPGGDVLAAFRRGLSSVRGATASAANRPIHDSRLGSGFIGDPSALLAAAHGGVLAQLAAGDGRVTPDPRRGQPRPRRPFLHGDHRAVSCLECHRTGGDVHGEVTVRTPRECASCHHDPRRGYSCESCHGDADMPPPGPVGMSMALSVWDEPRPRDLPFSHVEHEAIACTDCHGPGVMMPVTASCADCHDDHHSPQRECSSCHLPSFDPDVHPVESHLSCAGCHTALVEARPSLSRSLCLTCHTDQRDHEPQGTCHACHMIPELPHRSPATPVGAQRAPLPIRADGNGPDAVASPSRGRIQVP